MKRIIYTSTASSTTTYETVIDIINISNRTNKLDSITGMLIFNGTHFMQCIEGEETAVNRLMVKISSDPRHSDIVIVGEEKIDKRLFPQWGMGYLNREKPIRDLLIQQTGNDSFDTGSLNMDQAKTILVKLSFMI